ncbi:MAG: 16S rRNA (uracil(1498)-N(3))-methyltransferase [Myxococcaceae bacterium]|jgi:16S rRNA (uracil1498-N3)-methyltransferase|nr:16S rRNA (uracil(1498)-N(3))-methyltransferase [Myxococcaceae bacterium]
MKRVLVPSAAPGRVRLTAARFHHLAVVQRVSVGEALEVFDGAGQVFPATVEQLGADFVELGLLEPRRLPAPRRVVVVQGLPKADKLELVLQKGTELGAAAFLPAQARRSVVRLDGKVEQKLERWRRIVEEAARQCGRADVPEVLPPCPLEAVTLANTTVLVLDEAERSLPLSLALDAVAPDAPVALVVGPEGGLDRAEVDALTARGARAVTLGPLVLRTETAALAALAVIRHLDGQLG